jgi:hypothetical protein
VQSKTFKNPPLPHIYRLHLPVLVVPPYLDGYAIYTSFLNTDHVCHSRRPPVWWSSDDMIRTDVLVINSTASIKIRYVCVNVRRGVLMRVLGTKVFHRASQLSHAINNKGARQKKGGDIFGFPPV